MSAYKRTLAQARRKPLPEQSQPERLAGYCADILQLAAGGGYSPELVFDGAMAAGLTERELNAIVARRDHAKLDDLMFGP